MDSALIIVSRFRSASGAVALWVAHRKRFVADKAGPGIVDEQKGNQQLRELVWPVLAKWVFG